MFRPVHKPETAMNEMDRVPFMTRAGTAVDSGGRMNHRRLVQRWGRQVRRGMDERAGLGSVQGLAPH